MSEENSLGKYNHLTSEKEIYQLWSERQVFRGVPDKNKSPFCVVIPPPNVTGVLHMGHVLDNTAQDVMARWHRMRGFATVWIPGTDHAGIATQNVVKRNLLKEGVNPEDLGREGFLQKVWEWKEKHGDIIITQLKRLGCSCDWDRARFTMDEGLSRAVVKAFVHYYKKGLVYKGKRMINWCVVCGTALANDEVEHSQKKSHLWFLRYPLVSDKKRYVIVATTRPETMLGDTAIAVNPDDERYQDIIGGYVILPLQNRKIPIIADKFVDPAFGTGVVKVTPAHDPNDYIMGQKHKLDIEVVIGFDGKMTESAGGKYVGMDRFKAREAVVNDLEDQGFLEKIQDYTHSVGQCYRCNSIIEPMISTQWFVKMEPLASVAKQAVLDGRIDIIPDSEKHDYFHWMDTIQDWCISRQLWWGHRIPVYYCHECGKENVAEEAPKQCFFCGGKNLEQDKDVLDTWFSSQLWPFSTLGWPDNTEEFQFWYPTNWLMCGRDILFFWGARMIMAGLELTNDVPFRQLCLHGLVRDSKGRKLSKSLGNSPDPIDLFDKYGTDAVRASIMKNYPLGRQDIRLTDESYRSGQALIIKLWNAVNLLVMYSDSNIEADINKLSNIKIEDKWILTKLSLVIDAHDKFLNNSDFSHAFEAILKFFWNEFADWYLEAIKRRLKNKEDKQLALQVAYICIEVILKLFHPYIPFVTEKLWLAIKDRGVSFSSSDKNKVLALSNWPVSQDYIYDQNALSQFDILISIIKGARDIRHYLNIPPKKELLLKLMFLQGNYLEEEANVLLMFLGKFSDIDIISKDEVLQGAIPFKFKGGVGYLMLTDGIDYGLALKNLEGRLNKMKSTLKGLEQRLSNKKFIENAPEEIVNKHKRSAQEVIEAIEKITSCKEALITMRK